MVEAVGAGVVDEPIVGVWRLVGVLVAVVVVLVVVLVVDIVGADHIDVLVQHTHLVPHLFVLLLLNFWYLLVHLGLLVLLVTVCVLVLKSHQRLSSRSLAVEVH